MVDSQLLEQKSEAEKGYWQNIFHHSDKSPKPDAAVLTLAQVLSESAIDVFGLKFEQLKDVTSFHYDDLFEGIVMTFSAKSVEDEALEQIFEASVRVKVPESSIDYRSGELAVGTDFDPKEILFRNFFSAIGPLSKPVLTYDFVQTFGDRNASATVIWKDPVGRVAHVDNIGSLNNSDIREAVHLKAKGHFLPGIWSVIFMVEESGSGETVSAKIPFLVTPLLPVNEELAEPGRLRSLHTRKKYAASPEAFDVDVDEDNDVDHLSRQADLNAEKVGDELKLWILELATSFYNVEAVCWHVGSAIEEDTADPKLALLPKCGESEWSNFFPDRKSEF